MTQHSFVGQPITSQVATVRPGSTLLCPGLSHHFSRYLHIGHNSSLSGKARDHLCLCNLHQHVCLYNLHQGVYSCIYIKLCVCVLYHLYQAVCVSSRPPNHHHLPFQKHNSNTLVACGGIVLPSDEYQEPASSVVSTITTCIVPPSK